MKAAVTMLVVAGVLTVVALTVTIFNLSRATTPSVMANAYTGMNQSPTRIWVVHDGGPAWKIEWHGRMWSPMDEQREGD